MLKKHTRIAIHAFFLCLGIGIFSGSQLPRATADDALPMGGPEISENTIRRLRTKQAVARKREEILRYEVVTSNSRESRNALVQLLKDQQQTDEKILEFVQQMWEANEKVQTATMDMEPAESIVLSWPVEPTLGISADFGDPYYFDRFGLAHEAIDIPVLQGSEVQAVADGEVIAVIDNGLGYNYVIIRHKGFASLYGHVSKFFVEEEQQVRTGDVIALSGGTPKTPGAGGLTTGAHLHFELLADGRKIDPLPYLPYASTVLVVRE
jgi:murein DD-endopeptidase MepM/ murein hydrolase activator NlpD